MKRRSRTRMKKEGKRERLEKPAKEREKEKKMLKDGEKERKRR